MELIVTTREIFGKKVGFLRRQGITPAHLYGHSVESVALQCETNALKLVLAKTGATGLIELKLDKAKRPRVVMTREIQKDAITGELIHVDFYQVRMEEKIKVEVPIVMIGEAPALKMKKNFLVHELNTLEIECLPNEIPSQIDLDLTSLEHTDQALHVSDIKLGNNTTIFSHPEQVIVKISAGFVEREGGEEGESAPVSSAAQTDSGEKA